MKQATKQEKKRKPSADVSASTSPQSKKHVKQEYRGSARPISSCPKHHRKYLEETVKSAQKARAKGDHPFGCVLVNDESKQVVIEGGNSVVTSGDATCHSEMNVVRMACQSYTEAFLRHCTLYMSAEPCPMCAGAIYWSGIPRVVYALPEYELKGIARGATFDLPCREVFGRGTLEMEVEGPYEVEGMRRVHEGFWTQEVGHINGPEPARELREGDEKEEEKRVGRSVRKGREGER